MKIIKSPIIFLLLFMSFSTLLFAQKRVIDSLKIELQNHKGKDTVLLVPK